MQSLPPPSAPIRFFALRPLRAQSLPISVSRLARRISEPHVCFAHVGDRILLSALRVVPRPTAPRHQSRSSHGPNNRKPHTDRISPQRTRSYEPLHRCDPWILSERLAGNDVERTRTISPPFLGKAPALRSTSPNPASGTTTMSETPRGGAEPPVRVRACARAADGVPPGPEPLQHGGPGNASYSRGSWAVRQPRPPSKR